MKRTTLRCVASLLIAVVLLPTALAAEPFPTVTEVQVYCPTSVTRSKDGAEIRKVYDLSPGQDPVSIPRSDLEQDGFHYTLTDLLQQELPGHESRPHTGTVPLKSKSKGMESVLILPPQEKELVTESGLSGTLSLQLDTVQVKATGHDSFTREVSATRSYSSLASQDTASIPKSVEEDGRNLIPQNIDWWTDNAASVAGYNLGDCYTTVTTYTGTVTSSYVISCTAAADYTDIISRIALNRVRHAAISEREPSGLAVPMEEFGDSLVQFNWAAALPPLGVVFAVGGVVGVCLFVKRCWENKEDSE